MTEVCEAFDVLSNESTKQIFDQYGEEILKGGAPTAKGTIKGGYSYHGNNLEMFRNFFGTPNPFWDISLPSIESEEDIPSEDDIVVIVKCTLLEFYLGCIKQISYLRKKLRKDGKTNKEVEETREIEIFPGYSEETVLRYPKKGHEEFTKKATALVVKFEQIPEKNIKRKGSDLIQIHDISLSDALQATSISLVSLSGERIELSWDTLITPKTKLKVEGMGMISTYTNLMNDISKAKRGDLYVVFNIQFPKSLTQEQKDSLTELLEDEE